MAGRALARTASGLYRSDNHGASWTPLAFAGQNVGALAVDGATIWAAVGLVLQRSNDSGANWAPAAALPLPATALAARPAGGVYAGLANGWGPCAPGGMYRVTDGGEVSPLGLVAHPIHAIRVQANGDVFASAGDACSYYMSCAGTCNSPGYPECGVSGVYRSIDAGASWTRVTTQDGIPGKIVLRADGALCTAATGSWNTAGFPPASGSKAATARSSSWCASAPRPTDVHIRGGQRPRPRGAISWARELLP